MVNRETEHCPLKNSNYHDMRKESLDGRAGMFCPVSTFLIRPVFLYCKSWDRSHFFYYYQMHLFSIQHNQSLFQGKPQSPPQVGSDEPLTGLGHKH